MKRTRRLTRRERQRAREHKPSFGHNGERWRTEVARHARDQIDAIMAVEGRLPESELATKIADAIEPLPHDLRRSIFESVVRQATAANDPGGVTLAERVEEIIYTRACALAGSVRSGEYGVNVGTDAKSPDRWKLQIGPHVKHNIRVDREKFARAIEGGEIELRPDEDAPGTWRTNQLAGNPGSYGYQIGEQIRPSVTDKSEAVAAYMLALETMRGIANGTGVDLMNWSAKRQATTIQEARAYWAELANARIIELRPELYAMLYHEADVFTTEKIALQKWRGPNDGMPSQEEADDHLRIITHEGHKVPFPERLPFPATFFAMRHAVSFESQGMDSGLSLRIPHGQIEALGITHAAIIGYLVTERGVVIELIQIATTNAAHVAYREWHKPEKGWLVPYTLIPWILNALIELVLEHRIELVRPSYEDQRRWKRRRKSAGIKREIPPPYYGVTIRDVVVREHFERKGARKYEQSYRHDVSAHERVRIERGPMPMSDRDRKKFEKRGQITKGEQRIYTIESLREDDAQRLAMRGIEPKRADEWLAILVTQIDHHLSPKNESLPYVPAVRRLRRQRVDLHH